MERISMKPFLVLALMLIGLNARAENPKFIMAESTLNRLMKDVEAGKECIVAVEGPECKSGFQHVTPLDTYFWQRIALDPTYRAYGIYRWHSCRTEVKMRLLPQKVEYTGLVSSHVEEFESCAICTFTPKAPNQSKIQVVEADAAAAHAQILKLQGTPAFCQ